MPILEQLSGPAVPETGCFFVLGWPQANTVNFVRILLTVLAIIVLLVGTWSSIDSHTVQFAILPVVCLLSAGSLSLRFTPHKDDLLELTASPRLLAARAPPMA